MVYVHTHVKAPDEVDVNVCFVYLGIWSVLPLSISIPPVVWANAPFRKL